MLSFLAPAALKLLLGRMWGNAKADVARIPPKVKLALLGLACALALFFVHQHIAHKALAAAYNHGKSDEAAAIAKKALALKTRIDALTSRIALDERNKNDAENRRISAAADALRLRGPGKASCSVHSQPAAAAGGHDHGGTGDVAVGPLPDGARVDLIGLPFADTVDFAKNHDSWRAEALSWRSYYARLKQAWPSDKGK